MHLFSFLLIIPEILPIDGMCFLSSQPNLAAHTRAFAGDQIVQTSPVTGEWMSLQSAIAVTGRSEKTLRRYIKKGELKSKRTGKLVNSPLLVWIDANSFKDMGDEEDGTSEIFDAEPEIEDAVTVDQSDNFAPGQSAQAEPRIMDAGLETIIKAITEQFVQKLDEHKDLIMELRTELHEKDRQIRLLPDLQKQLAAREAQEKSTEFEKVALEKQIEALKQENDQLKQKVEGASQKKSWWQSLFSAGGENS